MGSEENKYEYLLKSKGLNITKGRKALLDVLKNSDKPMTYDEVYEVLSKQKIYVDISTVYRGLETFVENDIAYKFNGGKKNRALYELKKDEHRHYFFCVSCSDMITVTTCPMEPLLQELKTQRFKVFEHKLEVSGVCSECNVN